eukprot:Hpha_TRINITY_DN27449_c0_g1::TRINITY_DN27449_c0_g1_i1::g.193951::m.193951
MSEVSDDALLGDEEWDLGPSPVSGDAASYLLSAFVLLTGAPEGRIGSRKVHTEFQRDHSLRKLVRLSGLAHTEAPTDPLFKAAFAGYSRELDFSSFSSRLAATSQRLRAPQTARPSNSAFHRSSTDPAPPPRAPQDWSPCRGVRKGLNTDEVLEYIEYHSSARMVRDSVQRLYQPPKVKRGQQFLRKKGGRQSVTQSARESPKRGASVSRAHAPPRPEEVEDQGGDMLYAAYTAIRHAAAPPPMSFDDVTVPPSLRQLLSQVGVRPGQTEITRGELRRLLSKYGLDEWLEPLAARVSNGMGGLDLCEMLSFDGPPKKNPGPRLYEDAVRRQKRLELAAQEAERKELAAMKLGDPELHALRLARGDASPRRSKKETDRALGDRLCTEFVNRVLLPRTQKELQERLEQRPHDASTRERYAVLKQIVPAAGLRKTVETAKQIGPKKGRHWNPCATLTSQESAWARDRLNYSPPKTRPQATKRFDPEALPTHPTASLRAKWQEKHPASATSPIRGWGGQPERGHIPSAGSWLHESAPVKQRFRNE